MKRVVASSIIMKHLYLPKVLWLTSQPWYQVFCSGWVRPQSRVDSCISSSRVQLLNVADACRWDRGRGDEWTFKMIQNWLNISLASWTFSSPPHPREKHFYDTYWHEFLKKLKNSLCPTWLLAWIGAVFAQRLGWVTVQIVLCLKSIEL